MFKKKVLFRTICLLVFLNLSFFFVISVQAEDKKYQNKEKIPGQAQTDDLIDYLDQVYTFGIAVAGILAAVMISLGAFSYIVTSGGNSSKMIDAKDMITEAVFGLILALAAYLLLFVLNPDLIGGTIKAPANVVQVEK